MESVINKGSKKKSKQIQYKGKIYQLIVQLIFYFPYLNNVSSLQNSDCKKSELIQETQRLY